MTGRYAKRRLDDTRYSKKSNETRSYAKAMTRRYMMRKTSITRDEMSEMIHDRKKYAIHEETNETIRDKRTIHYATNLRKWAPGANSRATLIFFTNLQINPAVPYSIFGRGGVILLIQVARFEGEKAQAMTKAE